jgi:hypothetical protein
VGKALKVVGWFFGILFILFGLLLVLSMSPIAFVIGLIVVFVGALMCYGGNRSGRQPTFYGGSSLGGGNTSGKGNRSVFGDMKKFFYEHEEEFERYDDFRHRHRQHRHRP